MASHRLSARKKGTDVVGECVYKLHEKRRAVREEGMEGLVAALEGFVPVDELEHRYFTVFDRCCASLIRKGAAREATLAYRAVGLLALTVASAAADCSKEILDKALPILEKTIQASSSDAATLVAALDCLTAVTFAGSRRPEDSERSIKAVLGVIINPKSAPKLIAGSERRTNTEVLSTAVSAWALLLTTLGDVRTYPCAWKETMIPLNDLAKLLESDIDSAVRMSIGEALAVCVEIDLTQHASPEDMEALEIKVSNLAAEGNVQKLTEEQRLFRQITPIMSNGECPDPPESMPSSSSGRHGMLSVSTWARMVQLNFLKRFLGKGFSKHVQNNPLFRKSSSPAAEEVDELPAEKSKECKCGREKQWSAALRKDRAIRWEYKNSFSLFPYELIDL